MSKAPAMKEHDLQAQIIEALILAGFDVLETTAYRQKGSSGVAKGVPDLLVSHKLLHCTFIGMEVKRPGVIKWSSPEQQALAESCRFYVVQSSADALAYASDWFDAMRAWPFKGEALDVQRAAFKIKSVREAVCG